MKGGPWPCPLPGDAGLKKQGDPLAMSLRLSSVRSQQAAIMAAWNPTNAIADPVGFMRQSDPRKARAMQARRDNLVSRRRA